MARRTAAIPRHCLHTPSGRGYVRLNGRAFYTGSWGTTQAEARYERLVGDWLNQGRVLPDQGAERSFAVEDLIADYWVHARQYYRKNGRETGEVQNVRCALKPLRDLFGSHAVAEFGPLKLKAYREHLIDRGLSRGVVNSRVALVKRMFCWGVAEEKVPGGVAEALRCVAGLRYGRSRARETEPVQPVPEAAVRAVQTKLNRHLVAMVELQWLTGMRPGEVVQMRMRDLDRSGRIWFYRPASHKNQHHGKDRVVPLGPRAQQVLLPFMTLQPNAPLFPPREVEREFRERMAKARKTRVQPSQRARAALAAATPRRRFRETYSPEAYARAISRACELAGVPHWSPNQLRHAAATRIRREFGLEAARVLLGHSHMATTEIYAEIDQVKAAAIMEKCG